MSERTIQCPICSQPYVVFNMYSGDQSACGSCRTKARRDTNNTDFRDFPRESQQEYFGIK